MHIRNDHNHTLFFFSSSSNSFFSTAGNKHCKAGKDNGNHGISFKFIDIISNANTWGGTTAPLSSSFPSFDFVEDIFSPDGESHLSFLSNLELKNLRSSFEMNKIDSNSRINISRNKEIQVRIASNYKKYNNVYKSWNKKVGDNIKSIRNRTNG